MQRVSARDVVLGIVTLGIYPAIRGIAHLVRQYRRNHATLGNILAEFATARFGGNIRELELRLQDPQGWMVQLSVDRPTDTGAQGYNFLVTGGLTGSCGQTSNQLRDLTFHGAAVQVAGENNLYQALRNAGNTYLRVGIGCHSFMVEKRGNRCRIYQSYMGFDALADTIDADLPMNVETLIGHLRTVIHAYDDDDPNHVTNQNPPNLTDPNAPDVMNNVFHGEVNARRTAQGYTAPGNYVITCETPQVRRNTADEIRTEVDTILTRYDAAWNLVQNSDQTCGVLSAIPALQNL